ncbi:MAG: hypothetical protein ACYDAD_00130 [Acidimicrobiales bacterium]
MATVEEAGEIASQLPEVAEGERHGNRTWFVAGKAFAWRSWMAGWPSPRRG